MSLDSNLANEFRTLDVVEAVVDRSSALTQAMLARSSRSVPSWAKVTMLLAAVGATAALIRWRRASIVRPGSNLSTPAGMTDDLIDAAKHTT